MVDNLAAIFIEDVARHRGVTAEHVSENFGKGDVLLGQAALDAGMVDSLGTFEGLITRLQERNSMKDMTVDRFKAERPDLVEQIRAEAIAGVNVDATKAEAFAAGKTAGAGEERTRVLGIIGHAEAKGRESLALKLAGMPSMSIEGAAEIMGATPKTVASVTPGEEFEAVMKTKNPKVEADAATADGEEAEEAAAVARIAAMANAPGKRL
jgi:hypothetical protein